MGPETLEDVAVGWEESKEYELAARKVETFTRPVDVPRQEPKEESKYAFLYRDYKDYSEHLTEEQMQKTFADLRSSGELFEAFYADT